MQLCVMLALIMPMGYSDNHLAESLFPNASGTSSPAVDLFMALWFCRQEAVRLFFSSRE